MKDQDRNIVHPPQWPLRFLRWFCPAELYEAIEGDLVQKFQRDTLAFGKRKAKRRLIWNTIRFFRPRIILRNKLSTEIRQLPMFRNYFKTAFRYFANHKVFSGINLFGLATGMCVSFFALLYVNFELSYDSYHEQADNIYRLVTDVETPAGVTHQSTSVPMAPAIQAAFPEVRNTTRVMPDYMIIQKDKEIFAEEHIAYADPSLFSVFTLPLISGNPSTTLADPLTMVISESAAHKYFGTADCVGQVLILDRNHPATVTAVMKDMPHNSHFRTDMFISISTLIREWNSSLETNWTRFICYTYVVLDKSVNAPELGDRITNLVGQHIDKENTTYSLSLEPLRSVYLYGNPRGSRTGSSESGDINSVRILSAIAVIVLFIACFNFVNLTTAFSIHRAKEISVRKVFGASRPQLIVQFLTDAVVLSVLAFMLALMLCALLVPAFDAMAGKVIIGSLLTHTGYIALMFMGAVAIGLLSGIYPAFILSGLSGNLKGRFAGGPGGTALRKTLVVAQFSVAVILVIATCIIYQQLDYMQNKSPGFKKAPMLAIDFYFDGSISGRAEMVKDEMTRIPGVAFASLSSEIPGKANRKLDTRIENTDHSMQDILADAYFIDNDFLKQYEIGLVAGRGFSDQVSGDTNEAMILNEAAVKSLGYSDPKDAVGKRFEQTGSQGLIIGVVKDFHFHSLHEQVRPLTLRMTPGYFTFLTLTISPQELPATIDAIRKKWNEVTPDVPFLYFFTDEVYHSQYMKERRFEKLSVWFTTIAILISCLGLLGLSSLSAAQRTREVGIRKVLGASVTRIVILLTKDFVLLVVIAFAIGAPVAWYAMGQWLEGFAYHVDLSWWVFAMAGLGVVLTAFVTIGFQTVRAALVNPVDSLKTE